MWTLFLNLENLDMTKKIIALACERICLVKGRLHYEFKEEGALSIFQGVSSDCVKYWSNKDMEALIARHNPKSDVFPEHCQYNSEIHVRGSEERTVLAYIHNVLNPYVRIDGNASLREYSYLEPQSDFGWFLPGMAERLKNFPIVGYGFPAYLAIHANVEEGVVVFYQNSAPSNWRRSSRDLPTVETDCDNLFDQYCRERYRLYREVHAKEYKAWKGKENSKWDGEEARRKMAEFDGTFKQELLRQEQSNIAASEKLLSLYGGHLNKYVDYFIAYLKNGAEPQRKADKGQNSLNKQVDMQQGIVVTDSMVTDFALKFGKSKQQHDYRTILESMTTSNNAQIAYTLCTCRKSGGLRNDIVLKELHGWLQCHGYNVRTYSAFQKAFR